MDNFEEKYEEYLAKNKSTLSWRLQEEYDKFSLNFKRDFLQGNSFRGAVQIAMFLIVTIAVCALSYIEKTWFRYVIFIALLGIAVCYFIFESKFINNITDHVFCKYKYMRIVEDHIRRDEQHEIKAVLDEAYDKYRGKVVVSEVIIERMSHGDKQPVYTEDFLTDMHDLLSVDYMKKITDIRSFYDECLDRIKYEDL